MIDKNETLMPHSNGDPWDSELFVLQAASRSELIDEAKRLRDYLSVNPEVRIADLAAGMNHLLPDGIRLACVAESTDQLVRHLQRAEEKLSNPRCQQLRDVSGLYFQEQPIDHGGRIAFLYPGEGAQYPGMLTGLADAFPEVRAILNRCQTLAANHNSSSGELLKDVMRMSLQPDSQSQPTSRLSTDLMAVFLADWAYAAIMADVLGLHPAAAAGHSAGELSALSHANVLDSDEEVIELVRAMRQMDEDLGEQQAPAALLAVGASREKVEGYLAEANPPLSSDGQPTVYVAMDNCPHQTVLVGVPTAMAVVEETLRKHDAIYERLDLDRPYHTRLFEPLMGPLRHMFDQVSFSRPKHAVYSCTTGKLFPDDPDQIRDLAVAHWASPVEFTRMIQRMADDGIRIFVELGPRGNLTAFAEDILRGQSIPVIPVNVQRHSPLTQLNHSIARLLVHHVPLNVQALYARRNVNAIDWRSPPAEGGAPVAKTSSPRPAATDAHSAGSPPVVSGSPVLPLVAGGREVVVRQFQEVMDSFLDTQQQVMTDFLQRKTGGQRRRRSVRRTHTRSSPSRITDADLTDEHPTQHVETLSLSPGSDAQAQQVPYPLLGEFSEFEPGQRLTTRRGLYLEEEPYADQHTVGGQVISRVDPGQHGLPVMPMTFTLELMAEAAKALFPDLVVTSVANVRLQRWLAFYVEDPCRIEVTAEVADANRKKHLPAGHELVEVSIHDLGNQGKIPGVGSGLASSGEVVLAPDYPASPEPRSFELKGGRPSGITLDYLYDNLFHGPMFRGVKTLDTVGDDQILGTVSVLPRPGLFANLDEPAFQLDPVTLDTAMHPLAGWHLEQPDQTGRIMLPYSVDRVEFFRPCPKVGDAFRCQGHLRREKPRYVIQDLDVIGSDQQIHWRMTGIRMWRFYLPFDGVNFHGPKDVYFLSREWQQQACDSERSACVHLTAPDDLSQSGLLLVAAKVILSPREQQEFLELDGDDQDRANWLFKRGAAKDAVRKLFLRQKHQSMFVADIEMTSLGDDLWQSHARDNHLDAPFPLVATDQHEGMFVALASCEGRPRIRVTSAAAPEPLSGDDNATAYSITEGEVFLSTRVDLPATESI